MFKKDRVENYLAIFGLVIMCAVALAAVNTYAGVTVTTSEYQFELRDGAGNVIKELVGGQWVPVKRKTLADCTVAGEVEFRKLTVDTAPYRCIQVVALTYTGSCADEQPPPSALYGTLDAENFTIVGELVTTACLADDTKWNISQVSWVKKSWREKCWEKVVTPVRQCDSPPVADVVDPNQPDGPPMDSVMEPGPWIAGLDYPAGDPCPAAANGNCYVPPNRPAT